MFPWCPQNSFQSCPFVTPPGKELRLFASFLTSSVGVVLLVTSHRARLVNSAKNKYVYLDLKLENPRTLNSANPSLKSPVHCSFFALCEVRDLLFGFSAHCLHRVRVLVVCETDLP